MISSESPVFLLRIYSRKFFALAVLSALTGLINVPMYVQSCGVGVYGEPTAKPLEGWVLKPMCGVLQAVVPWEVFSVSW